MKIGARRVKRVERDNDIAGQDSKRQQSAPLLPPRLSIIAASFAMTILMPRLGSKKKAVLPDMPSAPLLQKLDVGRLVVVVVAPTVVHVKKEWVNLFHEESGHVRTRAFVKVVPMEKEPGSVVMHAILCC